VPPDTGGVDGLYTVADCKTKARRSILAFWSRIVTARFDFCKWRSGCPDEPALSYDTNVFDKTLVAGQSFMIIDDEGEEWVGRIISVSPAG
jgi:hypothetical protein